MAWPAPTLQWAPGAPPDSTNPTWVNISTSLRSGSYSRGRSNELEQFQAGQASFTLDNLHRTFDPSTRGDLIGSPIRVRLTTPTGSTLDLWRGHVTSLPQEWSVGSKGDSVAEAEAVDPFALLEQHTISSPWEKGYEAWPTALVARRWKLGDVAEDGTAPELVDGIDAKAVGQFQAGDGIISANPGASLEYPSTGQEYPQGVRLQRDDTFPDGSVAVSTASWVVSCWVWPNSTMIGGIFEVAHTGAGGLESNAQIDTNHLAVVQRTLSTAGGGLVSQNTALLGSTTRPHHIVGMWHRYLSQLYVDGVLRQESTHPSRHRWNGTTKQGADFIARAPYYNVDSVTPFRGQIQDFMAWKYASSATSPTSTDVANLYAAGYEPWPGNFADDRINAVLDDASWPSTRRTLDVGQSALASPPDDIASQTALGHSQAVAVDAEGGRLFIDGSGNVVFHNRQRNITSTRATEPRLTVTDAPTPTSTQVGWSNLTLRYTLDDIVNRAEVTNVGGVLQVVESTASRDGYGPKLAQLSDVQLADDLAAYDRAGWVVANKKDPRIRVESVDLRLGRTRPGGVAVSTSGADDDSVLSDDNAAWDILGDIEMRMKFSATDFSGVAVQTLFSRWNEGFNSRAYELALDTSGNLRWQTSSDGTAGTVLTATSSAPSFTNGQTYWVRVTQDANDGAGNRVIKFYKSSHPTDDHTQVDDWVEIGTSGGSTKVGVAAMLNTNVQLMMGAQFSGFSWVSGLTGTVYAGALLNAIGGTVVADPIFTKMGTVGGKGNNTTIGTDAAGKVWQYQSEAYTIARYEVDPVLNVGIGDRVNVVRTPSTGAAITVPAHVEGVEVNFDVQRPNLWEVTWRLANADAGADYLILNSTAKGLLDTNRLGF